MYESFAAKRRSAPPSVYVNNDFTSPPPVKVAYRMEPRRNLQPVAVGKKLSRTSAPGGAPPSPDGCDRFLLLIHPATGAGKLAVEDRLARPLFLAEPAFIIQTPPSDQGHAVLKLRAVPGILDLISRAPPSREISSERASAYRRISSP